MNPSVKSFYGFSLIRQKRYKFSLMNMLEKCVQFECVYLKGVFAKNERGYRLNAIKKRF